MLGSKPFERTDAPFPDEQVMMTPAAAAASSAATTGSVAIGWGICWLRLKLITSIPSATASSIALRMAALDPPPEAPSALYAPSQAFGATPVMVPNGPVFGAPAAAMAVPVPCPLPSCAVMSEGSKSLA